MATPGQFDETAVARDQIGRFATTHRSEANSLDLLADHGTRTSDTPLTDVLGTSPFAAFRPSEIINPTTSCDVAYDTFAFAGTDAPGAANPHVAMGSFEARDGIYAAAIARCVADGMDEDDASVEAIDWLNAHQESLDAVLAEDYGAAFDGGYDEWDYQVIEVDRPLDATATLGDALDALGDSRALALEELVDSGDYQPLLVEAEKYQRDKQLVRDEMLKELDHLTNTRGNATTEYARYAVVTMTHATVDGKQVPAMEVGLLDSNGTHLNTRTTAAFRPERGRIPAAMSMSDEDISKVGSRFAAPNANLFIDLDKVGANTWGRAKKPQDR